MENFIAYNPTKLHFGKGVLETLSENILPLGKKVLLMYGKGSVLKNGSYNTVTEQLKLSGMEIIEYNGIKSNPLSKDVDEAAEKGRRHQVDIVLGLGGGSVIDSAKITAAAIAENTRAWDIMKSKTKLESALPVIGVLTLAATGTEMNPVAVLQNPETQEKAGFGHPLLYPRHSFLDPVYTQSVPANYTAYGIVDLIAHCLENYFSRSDSSLSDRFIFSIMKEAMEFGPMLMNQPESYDLRARIMWAATNALNGMTLHGKGVGDWGVHAIGHTLSFLYDTPHGASLSIAYPAWLKFMKEKTTEKLRYMARELFNSRHPDEAIEGLESFFGRLNSPVRLEQAGIEKDKYSEILELMNKNKSQGLVYPLNDKDRGQILNLMYDK